MYVGSMAMHAGYTWMSHACGLASADTPCRGIVTPLGLHRPRNGMGRALTSHSRVMH